MRGGTASQTVHVWLPTPRHFPLWEATADIHIGLLQQNLPTHVAKETVKRPMASSMPTTGVAAPNPS